MNDLLEIRGLQKSFPGVKALKGVDFSLREGEVHALVGENGAGKSTLMKCITGVYNADEGTIRYRGKDVRFSNPRESQAAGIAIIHQELNLIPEISVAENIYLGREPVIAGVFVDWKGMNERARDILSVLGVAIEPNALVSTLSVAQQQMVEIAKALTFDSHIIVMDEPTDTLTDAEARTLFAVIDDLRERGVSIIYISHRLEEIREICSRVTVFRDGTYVSTHEVATTSIDVIIKDMVGRSIDEQFPYRAAEIRDELLVCRDLTNEHLHSVSFELRRGEVLGISGLIGAGRTELAKTLFGRFRLDSGDIVLDGQSVRFLHPQEAIRAGVIYVSEDRKGDGLVIGMSVKKNMTLSMLEDFVSLFDTVDQSKEREAVEEMVAKLSVKPADIDRELRFLSGGNQQKVAIGKALLTNPKVLILDEPTRGVDVGAKREIYRHINDLKERGLGVILISSDLPEVMGLSDRVMVMAKGKDTGLFSRAEATAERIMHASLSQKGTP